MPLYWRLLSFGLWGRGEPMWVNTGLKGCGVLRKAWRDNGSEWTRFGKRKSAERVIRHWKCKQPISGAGCSTQSPAWRFTQLFPPKHLPIFASLYGVTSDKTTVSIITRVATSNLACKILTEKKEEFRIEQWWWVRKCVSCIFVTLSIIRFDVSSFVM
jgi:hypothetical protein